MEYANPRAERLRRIVVVIALVVTVYYLYWRVTQTFNPQAPFFSWALWSAEVFSALTAFLFYFTVWRPITREAPPTPAGRTVDVLVTTKDEPVEVLRKTLLGCGDLRYPHRTFVLDDGDREEVRALCEELGCTHLARSEHEHAKAGNLNHGLEHSDAEFVAVFDADHVPLPDFLDRLLGYFEDDEVAYVQTPHEFRNVDSFQHRLDPEKKRLWAEQYLFFSLIQPGRDRWNASYFVGSCAILRRKALDDVGGFATASITEDLLTSILLHGKGWSSVYHHEHLAYGLAAETFRPFHVQRRRWGIGAWQVFFRANPLFVRGLSLPQRLCYLSSLIYPLEGFQKIIFYLTPPVALLSGVLPVRALNVEYLLHFVPYYLITVFAFNEMGRGFGGTLMLEQFSMGKFAIYLESLFSFLLGGRFAKFKVTPKGRHDRSPASLVLPQILIAGLSLVAVAWALGALLLGRRHDEFVVAVNCLWALYNSGLGLAVIQLDRRKAQERRDEFRIPDSAPVRYRAEGPEESAPRFGVATDLTTRGLRLFAVDDVPVGTEMELDLELPDRAVRAHGTVIRHVPSSPDGGDATSAGVEITRIDNGERDPLSRYLQYAAVRKHMAELSHRYRTFLERRGDTKLDPRERAERVPAFLPVVVRSGEGRSTFGVLRDVSTTGALVLAREETKPGQTLWIDVHLGDEVVLLEAETVRTRPHESSEFPEWLLGVKILPAGRTGLDRILEVLERIRGWLPA